MNQIILVGTVSAHPQVIEQETRSVVFEMFTTRTTTNNVEFDAVKTIHRIEIQNPRLFDTALMFVKSGAAVCVSGSLEMRIKIGNKQAFSQNYVLVDSIELWPAPLNNEIKE